MNKKEQTTKTRRNLLMVGTLNTFANLVYGIMYADTIGRFVSTILALTIPIFIYLIIFSVYYFALGLRIRKTPGDISFLIIGALFPYVIALVLLLVALISVWNWRL